MNIKPFNVYFDIPNFTIYYSTNSDNFKKIKIVVSDYYIDCTYFIFEENVSPGVEFWCKPLHPAMHNKLINNNNFPGFCIKFYTENSRLLQSSYVEVNKNTKKIVDDFHTDYFDQVGTSYMDFFYCDLCKGIDESGVVIDAGANVGFFTLHSKLNGASRIYSIEPDPSAFSNLKKNFKSDNNVILINKMLDDKNSISEFYTANAGTVGSSENLHIASSNSTKILVETFSLKSILDIEEKINLIKLDIEGTEFKVIEQLTDSDFNKINQFFIEFHASPKPIADKLTANGYEIEYRDSNENSTVGFIYAKKRI